jgi:hypothetical protein
MSEPEELGSTFIRNYSLLLAAVWGSEAEAAKLIADPTAYASSKGLPVAQGAVVHVDRTPHEGLFLKDEVIADWTASPGVHILHAPAAPVVDLDDLDDADLDSVNAGGDLSSFFIKG